MRRIVVSIASVAIVGVAVSACQLLLEDFEPTTNDAGHTADGDGRSAPDAPGTPDGGDDRDQYRDEVLADGPVLYWRFGEAAGSIAVDETKQRNGTYGSVALGAEGAISGSTNTAINLDGGATAIAVTPSGLDFPDMAPFTIEIWARQASTSRDYEWIIDHQSYTPKRNGWALIAEQTSVGFERWRDDVMVGGVGSSLPLPIGTYQHVVVTFDGAKSIIYIDGNAVSENPESTKMPALSTAWTVGGQNNEKSSRFIGSLDEFAVYDKPLSANRVLAHFHASGR